MHPVKPDQSGLPQAPSLRTVALRIALIYLAFAGLWMLFSDRLLSLVPEARKSVYFDAVENGLFAICTAALIFTLIHRSARQRASMEAALRRNETRYRSLAMATAQVVWSAEADGKISGVHESWQNFTGQGPEEYQGFGWLEAVHPEDRSMLQERWRKALSRESSPPNSRYYEIEYRVRRHDGVYRHFLTRTVGVRGGSGEIQEWVGICYDITEQKSAEQQLRDSESRYRSLVDVAPDTIFVHQDGRIIFMNPTGLRMLKGWNLELVLGRSPFELVHPEYREVVAQRIQRLSHGESVPTVEQRICCFDGSELEVEISATGFTYQGRPAVQVIMRDITARHQAQEQLRASENRFTLLTRATSDVVYDWDMTTNAIWWNENMKSLFGYSGRPEELGISFWTSLLHPDDVNRVNTSLNQALEEHRQFWADEYRFKRADGTYASILDRGYILRGKDAKPARMIGTMMDITDRKFAEQRLRDSREQLRAMTAHMEQVREEERTRIAREIHDELGQTLTGLKMDLSWFATRLPNQPALVQKSADMLKLIDSTVAAVRRLSTELRPAILDNLGLVAAIEWLAHDFQSRSGVECQFNPSEDELSLAAEQTTALFRICQEALTNVARYAQATSVRIVLNADHQDIFLIISDNGRGITEDEKQGRRSFGILGMRERARLLGGEFLIEGQTGRGTTLTVRLPSLQPAPVTA